jgi:hypothetical protein
MLKGGGTAATVTERKKPRFGVGNQNETEDVGTLNVSQLLQANFSNKQDSAQGRVTTSTPNIR